MDHMDHTGAQPDRPASHGMLVVGAETIFLSHLPMFHSPHDYQVLLRASFGAATDDIYRSDRKAHPDTRFHTFAPAAFVLPELFPGPAGEPPVRTSFTGSLVRNHFEQPPAHPDQPFEIASGVTVDVVGVVHHHLFDPAAPPSGRLRYLLFGAGTELFMAHRITRRPDFDQLLAVEVDGIELTDAQLGGAVELTVPDRRDVVGERIGESSRVSAIAHVDGADMPVEVMAGAELYVETADLS